MKKETYESVKHLENNFKTAIESKYTRALSKKDRNMIKALYQKYAGPVTININCQECLVTALQVVGKKYFEYKEKEVEDVDGRSADVKEGSGIKPNSRRNSKASDNKQNKE